MNAKRQADDGMARYEVYLPYRSPVRMTKTGLLLFCASLASEFADPTFRSWAIVVRPEPQRDA